jgi:IAA-amino acid hydrolase
VDPIVAATSAVLYLQKLVAPETDQLQGTVVSVTFTRGGEAFKVIPESATARWDATGWASAVVPAMVFGT